MCYLARRLPAQAQIRLLPTSSDPLTFGSARDCPRAPDRATWRRRIFRRFSLPRGAAGNDTSTHCNRVLCYGKNLKCVDLSAAHGRFVFEIAVSQSNILVRRTPWLSSIAAQQRYGILRLRLATTLAPRMST